MAVGPPRFELKSIPPQGTRMPSYPTGPNNEKQITKFHSKTYLCNFSKNLIPPMRWIKI